MWPWPGGIHFFAGLEVYMPYFLEYHAIRNDNFSLPFMGFPFNNFGPAVLLDMLTDSMTIEMLVPHRGLMLLISEIITLEDQHAVATAVVTEKWPLTTRAGANPLVLIELVAQTAALNNGLEIIQGDGPNGDHRGWIVGIKSARLFVDRIVVGTKITIESRNQFKYETFREVQGVAKIGNQIAAEVTLQLLQAEPSVKN